LMLRKWFEEFDPSLSEEDEETEE